MQRYDLVVIGSGPRGQRAAIQAAKAGKHVAVVDAEVQEALSYQVRDRRATMRLNESGERRRTAGWKSGR